MATKKPTTKKPAATKAPVKKPAATKTTKKPAAKKPAARKTVEKPATDGNFGVTHEKVQLWKDGPYWATTNIGAEKPEDSGYYFWWGDTVGYKREKGKWVAADGSSSKFEFDARPVAMAGKVLGGNTPTIDTDGDDVGECVLKDGGWITEDGVLAPEHDAAHVQWGGEWRMPTEQELRELVKNCDWTWTKVKGYLGYVVRGRGVFASDSIFLPCAGLGRTLLACGGLEGRYWSSSLRRDCTSALKLYSNDHGIYGGCRYLGCSVRPVQGFTK